MTNMKRIAIGAAVLATVAAVGYLWAPARMAFAAGSGGMIGMMMQGNMKDHTAQMMQGDMKDHMSQMMQGGMMGDMSEMMKNMGPMHEAMQAAMPAMSAMHEEELNTAAAALGMTAPELTQALDSGRSVEEIAQEKGVSLDSLKESLSTIRQGALDELVAAGTLTREQADLMLQHMNDAEFMTLSAGTMMQSGGCHGTHHGTDDTNKI